MNYANLELFAERERFLYNVAARMNFFDPSYSYHTISSPLTGSWIFVYRDEEHEGSFKEIADIVLGEIERMYR